jgi:Dyp-type peroxidase family
MGRQEPAVRLASRDVQGLVVSGYGHMHEARYLFLRVGDAQAARDWIGELADRVTTSLAPSKWSCLNVAFTAHGLRALGLGPEDLRTFSEPFREGMTAPHRRRVLNDRGPSAPERWRWGGTTDAGGSAPAESVHVLVLLFARDAEVMAEVEHRERSLLSEAALEVVYELQPEPLPGAMRQGKFGVEHFGFADGMSQPVIRGSGREDKLTGNDRRRTVIEPGEFVLGYRNGYGDLTPWPRLAGRGEAGNSFGHNGTYLVVRQLAQDVPGFWRYLDEATRRPDGTSDEQRRTWLASKLMGRWPSGASMVLSPHRDDPSLGLENGFGYAEVDPHGERCPLGSHARRANPRDALGEDPDEALETANRHRIVRRGRVYGPALEEDGSNAAVERGLFFICLNANLERQFEFVQHTWLDNSKFDGLYDEGDPIMGNHPDDDGRFTVQARPVRHRYRGLRTFVTTRGGGYFFLPGIDALRMLGGADP